MDSKEVSEIGGDTVVVEHSVIMSDDDWPLPKVSSMKHDASALQLWGMFGDGVHFQRPPWWVNFIPSTLVFLQGCWVSELSSVLFLFLKGSYKTKQISKWP